MSLSSRTPNHAPANTATTAWLHLVGRVVELRSLDVHEWSGKTAFFALAVVPLLLTGCANTPPEKPFAPPGNPVVEQVTDLGFGFRRIVMAEPVNVSFESIGHFEYLYYQDHRLCHLGACSVSPSGSYAIYQDGPSGKLFLFRRADGRITQLTSQFIALVESFQWHEDANAVDAHFMTGHGAKTFALP